MMLRRIRTGSLSWILFLLISSACGVVPIEPLNPTTVPVTDTFAPLPLPTSTTIPTATPAPLNLSPQIVVLAENLPEPDDLVLAPDGSIYMSDVTEGTIKQYTSFGQLNLILSGLSSAGGNGFSAQWFPGHCRAGQ